MSEASDSIGKSGSLTLTRDEIEILAHALNSTKLGNYNPSQKELLPTLGRKLSEYLVDTARVKRPYTRKAEVKPPKKLIGFALTRAPGSEWQQTRATLGCSFTEVVANGPAPLE